MPVEVKGGQDVRSFVRTLVEEQGSEKAELIPILHEINHELGYISDEAIQELSDRMHIPTSHIFSVATFYRMLSTEPRGVMLSNSVRAHPAMLQVAARSGRA